MIHDSDRYYWDMVISSGMDMVISGMDVSTSDLASVLSQCIPKHNNTRRVEQTWQYHPIIITSLERGGEVNVI